MSGSPPPSRAATVSSLMILVNSLPRLASAAPFLCLIDAHLEWPDMETLPRVRGIGLQPCKLSQNAPGYSSVLSSK